MKAWIPCELSSQIQKRLLKIVIALSRNFIVLEILLPVKCNHLCFHLPVLYINLVAAKDNGNILANPTKVPMPCGDIFVCKPCSDIEHDNRTLAMDVISIPKPTKLLLSRSIPAVEPDLSTVGVEIQGMDFDTNGRFIFLLKFPREMSLDEGSLPC